MLTALGVFMYVADMNVCMYASCQFYRTFYKSQKLDIFGKHWDF